MNHFGELIKTLQVFGAVNPCTPLVPLLRDCRMRGATLYLAGNGGSFATALHWAVDLSKVCAVRTHVLGANGAALTAWSNDESYAAALAAEFERDAKLDDVLIALSCSGTSSNICAALRTANSRPRVVPIEHSVRTVLITGIVNAETAPADITIRVPSRDYKVIEGCHLAIGHWLTKELAQ